MNFKELLNDSWTVFRRQLPGMLSVNAPYIAAVVVLDVYSRVNADEIGFFVAVLVGLVSIAVQALITLVGLGYLYQQDDELLNIDSTKVVNFVLASLLVGIATVMGLMVFVLPGIIIMAVTFFMPIFILREAQGSIEAVSSSARLVRDHLLPVTLFLVGVWVAMGIAAYGINKLLEVVSLPLFVAGALSTLVSVVIALYTLPVMKLLYARLSPESGQ